MTEEVKNRVFKFTDYGNTKTLQLSESSIATGDIIVRMSAYEAQFKNSDLGKIHAAIPWQALIKKIGLTDKKNGPKRVFSPKGSTI